MKVVKVRRRQHKTNYKKRITLLKSNTIRAVIRKSNRYLILQFVNLLILSATCKIVKFSDTTL